MINKPLIERLRLGVLAGLACAVVYSLIAWAVFRLKDPAQLAQMRVSLSEVVVSYWVGAVIGGSLVGVFLPIGRWALGAFALGTLAAIPFFLLAFLLIATDAPWFPDQIVMAFIASFVVGGSTALYVRSNSTS